MPGCRRADLAEAAFPRLDPEGWLPDEAGQDPPLEPAAFLHSADPERFVAVLRAWSDDPDGRIQTLALELHLRIGDPPSAKKLMDLAEAATARGEVAARPFVLVTQPSLFDETRAPQGTHTAWDYCHVPNGWEGDATAAIEAQIGRFAPGFTDVVIERSVLRPGDDLVLQRLAEITEVVASPPRARSDPGIDRDSPARRAASPRR